MRQLYTDDDVALLQARVEAMQFILDEIRLKMEDEPFIEPASIAASRRKTIYLRTADGGLEAHGPYVISDGRWVVVDIAAETVTQQSAATVRPDDDLIPQNELWIDLNADDIYIPRWG